MNIWRKRQKPTLSTGYLNVTKFCLRGWENLLFLLSIIYLIHFSTEELLLKFSMKLHMDIIMALPLGLKLWAYLITYNNDPNTSVFVHSKLSALVISKPFRSLANHAGNKEKLNINAESTIL